MSLAIVYSRAGDLQGLQVIVEVLLTNGLPSLSMVGLPETAVKESKDRVRGAIINGQFDFPIRRITINLAPADLPKEGGRFDLAIALGILVASEQLIIGSRSETGENIRQYEFVGELALSGELRPVKGILPVAIQARKSNRILIVPHQNGAEAALVKDLQVLSAGHLQEVCAFLKGETSLPEAQISANVNDSKAEMVCLSDIRGQYQAKRALEIAAAGLHSLLMKGPPGTGKTMLASRLASILPDMNEQEAEEIAAIRSVCGETVNSQNWLKRSFRMPHHTASAVALVGGGSNPRPGEISLAHQGILFMDELPEFDRKVLEVLREPLESGKIVISRAARQAEFPAKFQLIAAMNPCPCGYFGDTNNTCRCSHEQIRRYQTKLSGPLLDRIDIHIEVPTLSYQELYAPVSGQETSTAVKQRIIRAQARQRSRRGHFNARLSNKEIAVDCTLSRKQQTLLQQSMEKMKLSARAYHRILKLARTIADLDDCEAIQIQHLSEAISYRKIDYHS